MRYRFIVEVIMPTCPECEKDHSEDTELCRYREELDEILDRIAQGRIEQQYEECYGQGNSFS